MSYSERNILEVVEDYLFCSLLLSQGDDAWEPERLYAELASDLRGEGGAIGEHTIELEPDSASAGSEKEKRKQVGASKKRGSFSNIFGSN